MNTNDNPHDAPPELLAQAYRIALYFAERGIKGWTLGPVQKLVEVPGAKAPPMQRRPLSDMLDEDEGIKPRLPATPGAEYKPYPPNHPALD